MKDEIFKKPIEKQFEFDENVASVFDDMISRSVPYYQISSNLVCELLVKILKDDSKVVDLGCSTGTTLLNLFQRNPNFKLFGVDNSHAMLEIARNRAKAYGADIKFIEDDILKYDFMGFDAVLLNYTLQFIRPLKREKFVREIYDNLNDGGVFVFSEKLIYDDKNLQKKIIEIYEEYKVSQGYSRYEISQKREALENVLIPFSEDENKNMVKNVGFKSVETMFKWGNFAVFVAFK
ncbi:carboxy-S-adenosyl-L-methionine synthase CmoA [Campylobacter geochelonis]|uniref:Carboxy-S-adenosyl-L-methionine synthase n=1 Tax=Campylobacter geochelonis TaxID=1780362 RepID=A0A128EE33_9BACT|nr:carboxy-S-adenosyl-L-methionine synthase CmoA [Campylobacter geochelonis]QKF71034.1 carboxy-S-adenosyl-L-methionine synthase [Campylobacter geochelonis]CZE47194.1 putative methyltransferase [Campylobacter geochelonis]CZE50150.1 putative methyltransferase [Campylobacter geochelonis]